MTSERLTDMGAVDRSIDDTGTVAALDDCDPIPGQIGLSVLSRDPSQPWGFTRTPVASQDEDWWFVDD